jgi:hypothetical protein
MSDTDSGSESASKCVEPDNEMEHWLYAYGDSWSKAEDTQLTFEGTASAEAYHDCLRCYESKINEISVSTTIGGTYEKDVASISYPPAYTVDREEAEATLSDSRTDAHSLTLHHSEGAVVMEAENCWHDAYQDDTMGFHFDNDTYYIGYRIDMDDVGHCAMGE